MENNLKPRWWNPEKAAFNLKNEVSNGGTTGGIIPRVIFMNHQSEMFSIEKHHRDEWQIHVFKHVPRQRGCDNLLRFVSQEELRGMFNLPGKSFHDKLLASRLGLDTAIPGTYARVGNFLNIPGIPHPNEAPHESENLSILITDEMKKAIRELIGDKDQDEK